MKFCPNEKEKKKPVRSASAGRRNPRTRKNVRAASAAWRAATQRFPPAGTAADGDVRPELSTALTHPLTGHPEARPEPSPPAAHSSVDRSSAQPV